MSLTSEDLKNINNIVTKGVSGIQEQMVTKSELRCELGNFATKDDLDRMEGRLTTAINLLQRDSYSRLDDHDARITRLEKAVSP